MENFILFLKVVLFIFICIALVVAISFPLNKYTCYQTLSGTFETKYTL